MLLLENDITRKEKVDKNVTKFYFGNSNKYEAEVIKDSAVYAKKIETEILSRLYSLII